jgi:hypothetical protein
MLRLRSCLKMWLKYSTAQLMIKWMIMRSALGFTELDEMIEVDENDKIETVNFDLDQGEDEDTGNVEESFDNRMKDNDGKYKTSLISIGPSEVRATSGAI